MPVSPEKCRAELQRILAESLEYVRHLETQLLDERDALEQLDAPRIASTAAEKAQCVRTLDRLEAERRALCAEAGHRPDADDFRKMLRWCAADTGFEENWDAMLQTAQRCESLNRSNGIIGHARHEHVVRALTAIRGGSSDETLYSDNGRQPVALKKRELGKV